MAFGTTEAIAARSAALFEAGADHVAVQVVTGTRRGLPLREWRQLAGILPLVRARQPGQLARGGPVQPCEPGGPAPGKQGKATAAAPG